MYLWRNFFFVCACERCQYALEGVDADSMLAELLATKLSVTDDGEGDLGALLGGLGLGSDRAGV